jgi:hypothetical protein
MEQHMVGWGYLDYVKLEAQRSVRVSTSVALLLASMEISEGWISSFFLWKNNHTNFNKNQSSDSVTIEIEHDWVCLDYVKLG